MTGSLQTASAIQNIPRPPCNNELEQLWKWLKNEGHVEAYHLQKSHLLDTLWITVFDTYITDGPGYAGRLMYLIWGGTPECCDVFVWHGKELVHVYPSDDA